MNIFEQLRKVKVPTNDSNNNEYNIISSQFNGGGTGFGASGSSVPWVQDAPWSMNNDFDHDGIPDALDNYIGPGAWPK